MERWIIWDAEVFLHIFKIGVGVKGALSGLGQLLATESPLKMMKNALIFASEALLALKIFEFLYWLFGNVSK